MELGQMPEEEEVALAWVVCPVATGSSSTKTWIWEVEAGFATLVAVSVSRPLAAGAVNMPVCVTWPAVLDQSTSWFALPSTEESRLAWPLGGSTKASGLAVTVMVAGGGGGVEFPVFPEEFPPQPRRAGNNAQNRSRMDDFMTGSR
jgi:hypothetical protein